jgi:GNAT superfamily N-acetyltransferase
VQAGGQPAERDDGCVGLEGAAEGIAAGCVERPAYVAVEAPDSISAARAYRGQGLGAAMMGWAIEEARRRGCGLVQLTTDKSRPDAHRFYQQLGFVASHEGMKLPLRD